MALIGNTNEEKIWNYLKSKGLNDFGCAGLLANLFAESGLKPNNLQNTGNTKLGMTDEEYTKAVDDGLYTKEQFIYDSFGFSLAQWTYWSRKKAFYEYVKSKNKSIGDLETSLEFLMKELSESYTSVLNTLKTATTILQASNAVLLNFERPADQSTAVQNKRASYGQMYYDKYANFITQNNTTTGGATMSEKELRDNVVSIAMSYLGCKELDGSHKKIIDIYNNFIPIPVGYKVKYTDAWCATYVSAMGIIAGLQDIILRECSCSRMIELYKKAGRWIENDDYTPMIGDIIFYDWQDNGVGDNVGIPDHVGIVVSVNGTTIKVIEGNISDSVGYRTIKVNGKFIRGYGIPNYTSKAGTTNSNEDKSSTTTTTLSVDNSIVISNTVNHNAKVDHAQSFLKSLAGTYKTTANLNMRAGAGTSKTILTVIPNGGKVTCYGYYTSVNGTKWYYVTYQNSNGVRFTGFVSSKYLKK